MISQQKHSINIIHQIIILDIVHYIIQYLILALLEAHTYNKELVYNFSIVTCLILLSIQMLLQYVDNQIIRYRWLVQVIYKCLQMMLTLFHILIKHQKIIGRQICPYMIYKIIRLHQISIGNIHSILDTLIHTSINSMPSMVIRNNQLKLISKV